MNDDNRLSDQIAEAEAEAAEAAEAELMPTTVPHTGALAAGAVGSMMTAQQARVHEVTDTLAPAYARASTLELTDMEIAALLSHFPDNAVEIRPHDGLIYIPHIHISNRLNQVLKPGRWATICRRHWMEGATMYGEYVLVVRGCFVGESIGGHPYQPNNPKTNFSDALESTRAEALRRICGKTLGVGSQVWDPSYARNWVQQHAYKHDGKWAKKPTGTIQPQEPPYPAGTTQQQSAAQAPAPKRAAAGPPSMDAAADAANAAMTRRPPAAPPSARQGLKTPPAARGAAAPGHPCPKCRGGATKESEEWEGTRWCQRCGWQWDAATGVYFEAHDWARVICTRPPRGMKLNEYQKNPQTLGQISRIDNKRWYGLVMNNSEAESAKGYTSPSGKHYPATAAELTFGRACEDAVEYLESQKQGKEQKEEPPQSETAEDDVPF